MSDGRLLPDRGAYAVAWVSDEGRNCMDFYVAESADAAIAEHLELVPGALVVDVCEWTKEAGWRHGRYGLGVRFPTADGALPEVNL